MDETYPYIINFAELKSFEDRPFKQLSSGMKSRLAFAIASLVKPEILILDEVLSVGDGAFKAKSEKKMREIIRGGATTILVSHSIGQIRSMCNKVLWLDKGRQIVFTDDVEGACDCYDEFLRNRAEIPTYDPVVAKLRIEKRRAEKARNEALARQMAEDAARLKKVRELIRLHDAISFGGDEGGRREVAG
jgi:ABC-2 type transport system ATP-binding protein